MKRTASTATDTAKEAQVERFQATVAIEGVTVRAYSIIGTQVVVVSAWEPYAGHGTQTTVDGVVLGRIGTRRLPADLEALRGSARFAAVTAWHAAQYAEAYRAVRRVFGDLPGACSMGEVETNHAAVSAVAF